MKSTKITKLSHVYKYYASTYNVKILNSFNPELQFKDIESTIKNKLTFLFPELRDFKLVTTFDLELNKIESDDETKYSISYLNSKA